MAGGRRARSTSDSHRFHLRPVVALVGHLEVSALCQRLVDDLVAAWVGASAWTVHSRVKSLRAATSWARRRGLAAVDPLREVRPPRAWRWAEPWEDASCEVLGAFLGWLERWASERGRWEGMVALAVAIAAEAGCRTGELVRLRWGHWRPEVRGFVLTPEDHKTGRRTGRPRWILLRPALAARVEALRADPDRHPTHLLAVRVPWRDMAGASAEELRVGRPTNTHTLTNRIKRLRERAREDGVLGADVIHLYRYRHAAITREVQSGRPLADVAAMAGNSPTVIERTYLHQSLGRLARSLGEPGPGPSG